MDTQPDYESQIRNATNLDELEAMVDRDPDLRAWLFGNPEDANANAYRWDQFVPTFGGEHAGDAVDGWYVLSWDETRVLWAHPEQVTKMQERDA